MKAALIVAGASLFVLSGVHPILAGPCTDQISEVQKRLASSDAGSGPTMRTGSTDAQNVTGSVQSPNLSSAPASSGQASGPSASATPLQAPRAGEVPETQATAAMNAVTQDRATSPQDVRAQIQGEPTSSQVAAGTGPQSDQIRQAQAALERARMADQKGDAAGCSAAVNEARNLMGSR